MHEEVPFGSRIQIQDIKSQDIPERLRRDGNTSLRACRTAKQCYSGTNWQFEEGGWYVKAAWTRKCGRGKYRSSDIRALHKR